MLLLKLQGVFHICLLKVSLTSSTCHFIPHTAWWTCLQVRFLYAIQPFSP